MLVMAWERAVRSGSMSWWLGDEGGAVYQGVTVVAEMEEIRRRNWIWRGGAR